MRLRDAKVGDRVLIYVLMRPFRCQLCFDKSISNHQLGATVIKQEGFLGTTIAWKDGEAHPDSGKSFDYEVPTDWAQKGFTFAQQYNSDCFCEPSEEVQLVPQKNYGNECPCGIHPNQCDYHKP